MASVLIGMQNFFKKTYLNNYLIVKKFYFFSQMHHRLIPIYTGNILIAISTAILSSPNRAYNNVIQSWTQWDAIGGSKHTT